MPYGRAKTFDVRLEHYTVREFMGREMKDLAVALYLENGETGQYDILAGLITKSFGEYIGYKIQDILTLTIHLLQQNYYKEVLP